MLYTQDEIATLLDCSGLLELLPTAVRKQIVSLYGDDSRHYHDFDHAIEVLSWVVCALEEKPTLEPYTSLEVRLAALLHDVVYTVEGSPRNEEKSCAVTRTMLSEVVPEEAIDRVCELIMLTAQHGKLEAEDVPLAGQLLLDADIANLGVARWEIFLYNNRNVVAELRLKYSREQISKGRGMFFQGLLAKRSIYLSSWFRERFEAQARKNIQRLLAEEFML